VKVFKNFRGKDLFLINNVAGFLNLVCLASDIFYYDVPLRVFFWWLFVILLMGYELHCRRRFWKRWTCELMEITSRHRKPGVAVEDAVMSEAEHRELTAAVERQQREKYWRD